MKAEVIEAIFRSSAVSMTVLLPDIVADTQDNGPYMRLVAVDSLNTLFSCTHVDNVVIVTVDDPTLVRYVGFSQHTCRYEADLYTTLAALMRNIQVIDTLLDGAA
ncbi:hypothetical protein YH65_11065 [Sulfurovum lithotrophicum]|uniref:Uncharacterized protein n=1 Tax=Sulfurovum lithotrophicum TaxID=206403 RepID=A0A7U4M2V4_9BACT|nr:hypothetical protein [Sulfurovum lithotrophicum]AKF25861.1 hypothetical protein YH65_11065 [Sulfurovum lithotrophicum]